MKTVTSIITPETAAAIDEQVTNFRQGTIDFMRQRGRIAGDNPTAEQEIEINRFCDQHREQLIQLQLRASTDAAAAAVTFPGPLREAFCGGEKKILGYTLQPIHIALLSALERLEFPFMPMVEIICENRDKTPRETAAAVETKLKITIDHQLATIYCFVTPLEQVELELRKGKEHVIEHARKSIGQKHHPRDLTKLNSAIILYFVESYSTVVNYEPAQTSDTKSFPLAPA
jgi:hypothetical protein